MLKKLGHFFLWTWAKLSKYCIAKTVPRSYLQEDCNSPLHFTTSMIKILQLGSSYNINSFPICSIQHFISDKHWIPYTFTMATSVCSRDFTKDYHQHKDISWILTVATDPSWRMNDKDLFTIVKCPMIIQYYLNCNKTKRSIDAIYVLKFS